MEKISLKTKYVRTDGWRGYVQPVYAAAGANDTGSWEDSPCPSSVCKAELQSYKKALRKAGIKHRTTTCQTSNVFCVHHYVVVSPENLEAAKKIADEMAKETRLLYAA